MKRLKKLVPPKIIELKNSRNLSDYFLLTSIVGVGLFASIIAFTLTLKYQHKETLQRFQVDTSNLHFLIEANAVRKNLQFEMLAQLLEINPASYQFSWRKSRLEDPQFTCISLIQMDPKGFFKNEIFLKKNATCLKQDPKTVLSGHSELIQQPDGVLSLVKLSPLKNGFPAYLKVVLPTSALLPDGHPLIKVQMLGAGSISNQILTTDLFAQKTLPVFDQLLTVQYMPSNLTLSPEIGWAALIFAVSLVITLLIGIVVYSLINRNISIMQEVDLKTNDLRLATERAICANQTKSRFLAGVSHEVRTPLNMILGMAEVLAETKITPEQKNYVEAVRRAGHHLLDIINDILDVASIEAGEVVYEAQEISLLELVENVSDIVSVACRVKKLTYSFEISPDVPATIKADPKRLRQVLLNLINNSMKFTERGGITLSISMMRDNFESIPQILLVVKDTGIGIPHGEVDKIFGEFYQVKSDSKPSKAGVGLGLSIVKTYVDHLQGSIEVQSELGVGSVFTVALPVQSLSSETWIERIQREFGPPPKFHLFILSPNPSQSRFLKTSLEKLGCQVTLADSSHQALALLSEKGDQFTHFIIDLIGRDLGGIEFLKMAQFAQEQLNRIVILCPIVHRAHDLADLKEIGIQHVCYTPLKIQELIATLLGRSHGTLNFQNEIEPPANESLNRFNLQNGLRLLIAEDDEDNRYLIQTYLAHSGATLVFSNDGIEALEHFKTTGSGFDILITDIQMPRMDGFELIKNIRRIEEDQKRRPIPIVALTADAQIEQVDRVKSLGGNCYITKPISKMDLLKMINNFTRQSEAA